MGLTQIQSIPSGAFSVPLVSTAISKPCACSASPNVLKASARWGAPEGVPAIVLTVLTPTGETAELAAIRRAMDTINRCRGPVRHRFSVRQGHRHFVHLQATVGHDPARLPEDIEADIRRALGVQALAATPTPQDPGLFGLAMRDFHASVHASQLLAAIQNVAGVAWARLVAAQVIPAVPPVDPELLPTPGFAVVQPLLPCPLDGLLALHARHLTLGLVAVSDDQECR